MDDTHTKVVELARNLVRLDSRSAVSNVAVADRLEAELAGFEVERLDYADQEGVAKRALVARRGPAGGLGLSGHMDTVPDTGWTDDPWSGRIEDGHLVGLGAIDMKGQLAAIVVAAQTLPPTVPVTLLLTTDEEVTKAGAREVVARSTLAQGLAGIVVAEPTGFVPVRGHRTHIQFTAVSEGRQAHSSTGQGLNANWAAISFLAEMRAIHDDLRTKAEWHDHAYEPPFSDFNLVVDNHGTAVNVTVPRATITIKFRYSARIDPDPIASRVRAAAGRSGLALVERRDGTPPELRADHPLVRLCEGATGRAAAVAPYGTDASALQALAPCVILGPGDIAAAHKPGERVDVAALQRSVALYRTLCERMVASP